MNASYIYDQDDIIPYEHAIDAEYKPIRVGEPWGWMWGSAWFRFSATVPDSFSGHEVVTLVNVGAEGCYYVDGVPYQGICRKEDCPDPNVALKRQLPVLKCARGGETISLLLQAGITNYHLQEPPIKLNQACLAILHRDIWDLHIDMQTLESLMYTLPDDDTRRRKITYGLNEVANHWRDGDGIKQCREITTSLLSKPANASALTAYSTGHAHLDLAWLWPVRETKRKAAVTFANALKMMEEYPTYTFGASQPQLYQWVKDLYPGLYERVKQAVSTKQWECQGIMWVESDCNMPSGESLVRQCLYGKRFFKEEFDIDARIGFLPDVFGFCAQLPQILKKCGADYFLTSKLTWNETNEFPFYTYFWQGLDGTRILSHLLPSGSYHDRNTPKTMAKAQRKYHESEFIDAFINLYGIGDGGGGPYRKHIEYGLRMADCEGLPKVKYGFVQPFFEHIEDQYADQLPTWSGELYLELHRGVFTSQARMKKYNRLLERHLHDIEFLATVSGNYPQAELERIWKGVLLNQFHDTLPGTSIKWVYDDAHRESLEYLDALAQLQTESLGRLLPSKQDGAPPCSAVALWNTTGRQRHDIVAIPRDLIGDRCLVDESGQALECADARDEILIEVNLPAMGYKTFKIVDGRHTCRTDNLGIDHSQMENELVRYRFNQDGTIDSIYDKAAQREVLSGKGNQLLLWEDRPNRYDAWDIDHHYRGTTPQKAVLTSCEMVYQTPLCACLRQAYKVGQSEIVQHLRLKRASKALYFDTWINWNESHRLLRTSFQTSIHANTGSYEVPFGVIQKPGHSNTSWDYVQFENCAHRYADLSEAGYGTAILNDCKYGYWIHENIMEMALLRSPKEPDDQADQGEHTFTYAFLPHDGDLTRSNVFDMSRSLNQPVIIQPLTKMPDVTCTSYFSIDHPTVYLDNVKQSENGSGTILRIYETMGMHARATLQGSRPWKKCCETDLLENIIEKRADAGNQLVFDIKPFEIKTFLIQ